MNQFFPLAFIWLLMLIAICGVKATKYEYFPECQAENYKVLNDSWRFHSHTFDGILSEGDNTLQPGWYRFANKASRLIETNELHQLKTFDRVRTSPI